ncbi:MAG: 3-hydroxyisobutyrate dehydrogenase [Deltaproteobacteria bacterium]|nr:3-hydroxyisobutyrate dehydrogenase [Deltaproteobacteria bacterium]
MKLGFLGLGIMGTGMAHNLLKAGFSLTVYNRTASKCAPFVEAGATQADTAADVVRASDITFAIVSDPEASRALCFSENGVLDGISEGKGYVDMSTINAETSKEIGEALTAKGGRYLEAPVSGSKKPAADGTLIILAGGDKSLYDEAEKAFEAMGKKALYLGEVGNGANMKLVVNMIMGAMMAGFCEGMSLAEKAGLSTTDLLDVLDAGAMSNPMFRIKGPLIQQESFGVAFPLKHMQKDMRLAIALGDQVAQPLSTCASANESFKKARALGAADEDFSAVSKAIKTS